MQDTLCGSPPQAPPDDEELTPDQQAFIDKFKALHERYMRHMTRLVGSRLAHQYERLFARLMRYSRQLEALEETPPDAWRPRVRFQHIQTRCEFIDAPDGCLEFLREDGWETESRHHVVPVSSFLVVVDRQQNALATLRAKMRLVDRHLSRIKLLAQQREEEYERMRVQVNMYRELDATLARRAAARRRRLCS